MPSDGGAFEVTVNGKVLFSKLALHRFPEEREIVQLIGAAKVDAGPAPGNPENPPSGRRTVPCGTCREDERRPCWKPTMASPNDPAATRRLAVTAA